MRFWVIVVLCAVGFVSLGSDMVESRNKAVAQGYRIAQLTRKIAALEEQIEQLKIRRAGLLEPSRLKTRAKENALKESTSKDIVVMEAVRQR